MGGLKWGFLEIHWGNVTFVALTGPHTHAYAFEDEMQQSMFKQTFL